MIDSRAAMHLSFRVLGADMAGWILPTEKDVLPFVAGVAGVGAPLVGLWWPVLLLIYPASVVLKDILPEKTANFWTGLMIWLSVSLYVATTEAWWLVWTSFPLGIFVASTAYYEIETGETWAFATLPTWASTVFSLMACVFALIAIAGFVVFVGALPEDDGMYLITQGHY